jgi:hypothetical protein
MEIDELLGTYIPYCKDCGMVGTKVETITDMIVWHHINPEVEDNHDFNPHDDRDTIIFDPERGD